MKKRLIHFLIEQYGQRVDFPQPFVNTDNAAIENQLTLVNRRMAKGKRVVIFWVLLGVLWIILGAATTTTEPWMATNWFKAGLGIFYIASALFLLNQVADLRRKKLILETILFVNKAEE
ncbi:MAG: hypothetical protein JNN04_08145 [Cyclobacteriaceae bacterium]|nr:hypothetical protein [Cyclobacteriaceae bacterium]